METLGTNNSHKVIVGLGQTGLSCARFLSAKGERFKIVDSRQNPPGLNDLKREMPNVEFEIGGLERSTLLAAKELIVSPGIDLRTSVIKEAVSNGVNITGDVDIFAKQTNKPIIAITGSNAKSTVVTLLGEMAKEEGILCSVAGNIGLPVLDALKEQEYDMYILELSSFQLETTRKLGAKVACVLNMSPDHLDRYDSMQSYHQAKHRIFQNCEQAVINRDDPLSKPLLTQSVKQWSFGLSAGDIGEFGVINKEGKDFIAFNQKPLLIIEEMKMIGKHNISNALAALTIGYAAGFSIEKMIAVLRIFPGLDHRCQWIANKNNVDYYNDSKGTNVGASVAAIESLGEKGKIVLIAGGVAKDADFSKLTKPLACFATSMILIGEDAQQIAEIAPDKIDVQYASNIVEAVNLASESARSGDIVLLSPACASFDMFRNFEHRGDEFVAAVKELH